MMLESDGPGGAEIVMLRLSEELRERGHWILPVGPSMGEGWLARQFVARGFEPDTFTLKRPLDPACLAGMVRMLRRHQIGLVHSHEFTMAVYGTAACRILGIPHVITMHGSQTVAAVLRRRLALRWAFRNSRAVVTISDSTRASMCEELGVSRESIVVVPNGVPVVTGDPLPVRLELGIQPDELVLLSVGNLDKRKGHAFLLEALDSLERGGLAQRWRLIIAAGREGEERARLEELARAGGFLDRVHFLTRRTDVANLLAAADIFVLPSLWEGLPMAMLEAMLAGKAVLASDVSGIPEAVTHGSTGLLVPPADSAALARELRRLLDDSSLRSSLAEAARRHALDRFTVSKMTDGYEQLYFG